MQSFYFKNHILTIVKYIKMSSCFIIFSMKIREAQNFSDEVVRLLVVERHKQGLTNYQVAQKSNISEAALSYIERNERRPTLYTLKQIADAIGVKLSDIIRRAEESSDSAE